MDRLTETHRVAQLRLGALTVSRLLAVWPLLDPENLDRTFQRWLQAVASVVAVQRAASARLASGYLQTFRTLELGVSDDAFAPVLAGPVDRRQLAKSMLVTGPVSVRAALGRGVPFEQAVETAQASSASAGMRHALNGGRATILATVAADRRARGWKRVTSSSACAWCASTAGTVSSDDDFRSHDHCACTAAPVYR